MSDTEDDGITVPIKPDNETLDLVPEVGPSSVQDIPAPTPPKQRISKVTGKPIRTYKKRNQDPEARKAIMAKARLYRDMNRANLKKKAQEHDEMLKRNNELSRENDILKALLAEAKGQKTKEPKPTQERQPKEQPKSEQKNSSPSPSSATSSSFKFPLSRSKLFY